MKYVLLALLLSCSLCAETPLPADPNLRVGTLSSGITYYIWPCSAEEGCHPDDRISLRLVVPIGSGVEEEGEEGIAHFLEHLLFRGSVRFSESDIKRFISAAGGGEGADANALTSFDATIYLLNLPPHDWSLVQTGLEIFADFAERALIEDASVEAERGIVLEEWRLGRCAQTRMMEERISALLDGSPYAHRLAIGLEETVRSASGEKIRTFYDRWYRSVPLAIIATGPFEPEAVEHAIIASFDAPAFPVRERTHPALTCPVPHTKHLLLTKDPELTFSAIEISFKRPARALQTEEDLKEELIASAYHTLIQRRLLRLQEQGLLPTDSITVGRDRPLNCLETDTFELICTPGQTLSTLNALAREIHLAGQWGFTPGEWERTLAEAEMGIRSARQGELHKSPADLANQCQSHFVCGGTLTSSASLIGAIARVFPTITLDEIRAFAESLSNPDEAFVHIACPETLDLAIGDVSASLEAAKTAPYTPYDEPTLKLPPLFPKPGRFACEEERTAPYFVTLTAANGMTIHLMPTQEQRDIVCEAVAIGGLSELPLSELPSGRLANALLDESGIGGLTPFELTTALAGTDAALRRHIATYKRTLTGGCHPDDVEALFKLLHLAFTAQVNRPDIFERLRARNIAGQDLADTPSSILYDTAISLTRSGAPYFQPTKWENATFEQADTIALAAFSNPADFTLAFAGPFDPSQMRILCAKYLASIPNAGPAHTTFTPLEAPFPTGITHTNIYKGQETQSTVELYFPISLPDLRPETLTLLGASIDLIRSRIYDLLRGALSATYHVEAGVRLLHPSRDGGLLLLSFVCDPADADLLSQLTLRELRKLRESGPTSCEIQTHRLQTERYLAEEMRTSGFWSKELTYTSLFGWDLAELGRLEARPRALTKEALHQMIIRLLPLDNHVALTLYPEH